MQAQANRTTQAISSAQSLAVVQTLLRAGLGCITFMRELLPQDNFTQSHFTTEDDGRSYSSSSSFSTPDGQKGNNINGFKIMTMCRGYTDEADKMLNYLEYGIFDALQKQYLRSFIFAIYLDNKNPNNIVEAYTFNFRYHTIAGTDTIIPIMTLGENLNKMSLQEDPLLDSVKKGKIPTLKDVKKSVKALLKTLISSMVQMDVLPKRRYASFKLFYTDDTPAEYEPPHFKAGHHEKDKWYFMTHDFDEAPDRWNAGKIDSGYHSVEVNVSSIATYLPSSTEHENAPFTGLTSSKVLEPSLTPVEEAARRAEQTFKQMEDADKRNVVWAAEAEEVSDADGEYDIDPDYMPTQLRTGPIGIRGAGGSIDPLPESVDATRMDVDEAQICGATQTVPLRLHDLLARNAAHSSAIPETQSVEMSQEEQPNIALPAVDEQIDDDSVLDTPTPLTRRGTVTTGARSRIVSPPLSPISSIEEDETQIMVDVSGGDDAEMLDIETQAPHIDITQTVDTIESFEDDKPIEEIHVSPKKAITKIQASDDVVECECGIPNDKNDCCYCEGGCNRWYHVWCMGYHSANDRRLPDTFICFDCCVQADPSWELIRVDLYPTMMSKFKELASFRRAIKVMEKYNPSTLAEFGKKMKCNNTEARQLFKRLETEGQSRSIWLVEFAEFQAGFILEQTTSIDEIGVAETRTRGKAKGRGKSKAVQRRNVQKSKYIFNRQSVKTQAYKDYFNPDREAESRLLGIPQTKASIKSRKKAQAVLKAGPSASQAPGQSQSQTQEESLVALELFPPTNHSIKRTSDDDSHDSRPRKKTKISLAPAVDLAE
uniref:HORMA domain-containing protein n=1 Tax=Moniliophthora roreri TaxID=221103 RepID=A0A0W0FFC8_MONRR